MTNNRIQMKIYIDASKKEQIEGVAQALNKPVNTVMNEIVDAYLKEQTEKVVIELWTRGAFILKGGLDA